VNRRVSTVKLSTACAILSYLTMPIFNTYNIYDILYNSVFDTCMHAHERLPNHSSQICTLWFTLEIVVRLITCPSKLTFCKDIKNLIDVTAILPYYVTFFNVVSTMSCASAKSSASLAFLRVTRLIRIFKLTKHSVGLQVLYVC